LKEKKEVALKKEKSNNIKDMLEDIVN